MKLSQFIYTAFLLSLMLFACQQEQSSNNSTNDETEADTTETEMEETVQDISGCYLYAVNQDSIRLQINQSGDAVSGWLNYDFHQKDGSIGKIEGEIVGDTIKLNHNFLAEGTISNREIYFLVGNNEVREGAGEIEVEGNTSRYADPTAVDFSTMQALKQVECADNFMNAKDMAFYENEVGK